LYSSSGALSVASLFRVGGIIRSFAPSSQQQPRGSAPPARVPHHYHELYTPSTTATSALLSHLYDASALLVRRSHRSHDAGADTSTDARAAAVALRPAGDRHPGVTTQVPHVCSISVSQSGGDTASTCQLLGRPAG